MSKLIVSPEGEKSKEKDMPLPAFPLFGLVPGALQGQMTAIIQGGMTLRDYFAGQYLAAVYVDELTTQSIHAMVKESYQVADLMLLAREGKLS